MQLGIRIPPCGSLDEVVECIAEAERLGFDAAWLPDSPLLWRDTMAALTLAATRTKRITLATCVTNVSMRHPAVLASAANTVAELAPGRVVLGIGAGGSALRHLGLRPTRHSDLRTALEQIQALLEGSWITLGGERVHLWEARGPVPLLLAATGPRNLAMAGELADGVILPAGFSLQQVGDAMERAGVARSDAVGRQPFDVVATAYATVTSDVARDARELAPVLSWRLAEAGAGAARQPWPEDSTVQAVYPDMNHAEDWPLAVRIAGERISEAETTRYARESCLYGEPTELASRVRDLEAKGVTTLVLRLPGSYELPYRLMRSVAESLLPRLSGGG